MPRLCVLRVDRILSDDCVVSPGYRSVDVYMPRLCVLRVDYSLMIVLFLQAIDVWMSTCLVYVFSALITL